MLTYGARAPRSKLFHIAGLHLPPCLDRSLGWVIIHEFPTLRRRPPILENPLGLLTYRRAKRQTPEALGVLRTLTELNYPSRAESPVTAV
jgi:hypothetical protein